MLSRGLDSLDLLWSSRWGGSCMSSWTIINTPSTVAAAMRGLSHCIAGLRGSGDPFTVAADISARHQALTQVKAVGSLSNTVQ